MQQEIQAYGLPWFEADDYESFKPILTDRNWHRTFAEWEAVAEQNLKRLTDQGFIAIKAKVRSTEFVQWCRSTGRDINTEALTAFGAEAAYRHIQGQH